VAKDCTQIVLPDLKMLGSCSSIVFSRQQRETSFSGFGQALTVQAATAELFSA
jgi:hypothetical protein